MFVNFTYSQSISIDANDTRQYIFMMGADRERSAGNLQNVATNRDSIIKWVVNIYPNPVTEGQVTINFGSNNTAKIAKIQILNLIGKTILNDEINIYNNKIDLKLNSLITEGLYLVRVLVSDEYRTFKLIVQ
ncbi:T9SS type A sorting domain-containing protein [Polaribacter sp. Asnod6-C07]|uniref:T9SS type A sorting domain-containing protein n=1 Tax=Polaribacter sp. Asnod6-C07 TaxID=3160582 RepID=UPI00386CE2DD